MKGPTGRVSLTPVRTFVQKYTNPPDPCKGNANCIGSGKAPLFKNIRTSLIDPDTPQSVRTKKAADGSTLKLVVCRLSLAVSHAHLTMT